MAIYPVKMLKDEDGNPFVPLTQIGAVVGEEYTTAILNAIKVMNGHFRINKDTIQMSDIENKVITVQFPVINETTVTSYLQLNNETEYPIYDETGESPLYMKDSSNTACFLVFNNGKWKLIKVGVPQSASTGHAIMDSQGNIMPSRGILKFNQLNVTDSASNASTIVTGPTIINNVTTLSANQGVLDAYQGKILNDKFSNYLPLSGGTLAGTVNAVNNKLLFSTSGSVEWKENGYGDKFRIIPAFSGADDANVLQVQSTLGGAGEDPTNWTTIANISAKSGNLSASGMVSGNSFSMKKLTSATVSYADKQNPRIDFINGDGLQAVAMIFTDYDSYRPPYGLTVIGNGQATSTNGGAYLKVEGDIIPGRYVTKDVNTGGTWINMTHGSGAIVYQPNKNTASANSNASAVWGVKTNAGAWGCGVVSGSDSLYFVYGTDSNYSSGTNTTATAYISSAGAFTSASSRKTKENIQPYTDKALDIVNDTLICSFNYKADNNKSYRVGFIADDTNSILSGENHDAFDINNTVGILFKAVQELSEENKILKAKIEKLEEV